MRRRSLLVAAGATLAGCAGGREGGADATGSPTDTPRWTDSGTVTATGGGLSVSSEAFDDGGSIPEQYTCDGEDISPPLSFDGVPDGTETSALVMDDPDAPREEPFVHWLLWNLSADRRELPEDVQAEERALDARQGTNSFGDVGYGGPCPPEGDDAHTYRFHVFALDTTLDVEAGAERDELESAMAERVAAEGLSRGEYERR